MSRAQAINIKSERLENHVNVFKNNAEQDEGNAKINWMNHLRRAGGTSGAARAKHASGGSSAARTDSNPRERRVKTIRTC
ncbi:unnamed protein product, partial [Iphiclides podalirius]